MTNKKIFQNEIFNLPKRRNGKELTSFLNDEFNLFSKQIFKFNSEIKREVKIKMPFINDQIRLILSALDDYYKGFPAIAYSKIAKSLDLLTKENILPIQKVPITGDRNNFFRIRVSDNRTLLKSDIFHIPFQLREQVLTQRYSIPGLPCLYLGDSIFVCWEELGRPDIDKLHVSRFDLSKSGYKFLHFNVSVNDIRKRCFSKNNDEGRFISQIVSFLCYWPLFAACSIIVDKPNSFFKPEYIIPQLVLQWVVSTKKLDGIHYKSNRVSVEGHNFGTFTNIVIPIKNISERGFCNDLKTKIKLTNPISWQLLDIAKPISENEKSKDVTASELRHAMYIELIKGEKTFYHDSKFGLLEEKLKKLSPDFI